MMRKKSKQTISSGDNSFNLQAGGDIVFITSGIPKDLIDHKIDEEIEALRKSRFFREFNRVDATRVFGRQLVEGDFSGGTDAVKCRALAWCARILSYSNYQVEAERYLKLAKRFGTCLETDIAAAFVYSQKGDKKAALSTLAEIASPASRSAAFMVVSHHEGGEGALDWLENAGFKALDLDAEGKYFLLASELELGRWEEARENIRTLNDQDLEDAPALHHVLAITCILSTVPSEFRAVVLKQLPFEAASFPLASDVVSLDARRTAQRHFADAAVAARKLNCPRAAMIDEEYALWLELKDPVNSEKGKRLLEEKFSDTKSALRLVPLGLQFGIRLNLTEVEREINRQIAIHGKITADAAIARFALAFIQKTPAAIANYVTRHFDELSEYFDPKSMRFLQIEMFSQAGLPEKAKEYLKVLMDAGLTEAEERRLQ
ncbi:MAG TPA: HNH endonuclease, partial [bacterium]|nr:HNH endonuclease [bacterium]